MSYETVFGYVYAVLRVNLCLLAAGFPLVLALAFTRAPLEAWPFFVALAALCGPAVTGAFAAFEAMAEDTDRVGRRFWAAYRAGFGRSLAITAVASAVVIGLGVDLQLAANTPFKPLVPMLAALIAMVVIVTTAVLATGRRLHGPSLLACAYVSIRKWYLSLADLAVLGLLLAAIVAKPALGLAVLPAPALFIVWANTRHITAPLTETS